MLVNSLIKMKNERKIKNYDPSCCLDSQDIETKEPRFSLVSAETFI